MAVQEVKGSGIVPVVEYIRQRFGQERWIGLEAALPQATRQALSAGVLAMNWYPLVTLSSIYDAAAQVLGGGAPRVCWEIGKASADYGLGRVYKFFLSLGNPTKFVSRGPAIWTQYYRPGTLEVIQNEKHHAIVELRAFETSVPHLHSIAGWMERAGELTGGQEMKIVMDIPRQRFEILYR
jgi:hypothetical protein